MAREGLVTHGCSHCSHCSQDPDPATGHSPDHESSSHTVGLDLWVRVCVSAGASSANIPETFA